MAKLLRDPIAMRLHWSSGDGPLGGAIIRMWFPPSDVVRWIAFFEREDGYMECCSWFGRLPSRGQIENTAKSQFNLQWVAVERLLDVLLTHRSESDSFDSASAEIGVRKRGQKFTKNRFDLGPNRCSELDELIKVFEENTGSSLL